MAENSAIEWTHHTFNPWIGCSRVSEGCTHCYAEQLVTEGRLKGLGVGWGKNADRHVTSDGNWKQPLRWNRQAISAGERRRVFCASLADVFEDRPDLVEPRARLWQLIEQTPGLDWLLLTKRPENIARLSPHHALPGWWDHVWIGTTVENQAAADVRIPLLTACTSAAVRFLSVEPMIGPVVIDFEQHVDWVICGGESGPGSRPLHPEWARSVRDQCAAVGVPFLMKQWGDWRTPPAGTLATHYLLDDGRLLDIGSRLGMDHLMHPVRVTRLGKKAAGRLLDGVVHDGYPDPMALLADQEQRRAEAMYPDHAPSTALANYRAGREVWDTNGDMW